MNLRIALALSLLTVLAASCAAPVMRDVQTIPQPTVEQSKDRYRKVYVLAPGDQIEVLVRRVPEASRAVTVRPDGYITLPLLDDVRAAGLTPPALDEDLTVRFAERLIDPEVTVIATQVREPMVYVLGEVARPMAVPLRDAPSALQAVALAGGLLRSASSSNISLIRLSDDGYLRSIPLGTAEKGSQPGPMLALRQTPLMVDDVIFVPESGRSQFSRGVNDFLNTPLNGINSALQTVVNFELVDELQRDN